MPLTFVTTEPRAIALSCRISGTRELLDVRTPKTVFQVYKTKTSSSYRPSKMWVGLALLSASGTDYKDN